MNALVTASRTRIAALAVMFLVFATAAVRADDLKDGHAALAAGNYDQALALFEKAAGQGYAAGRAGVGEVWLKRRQYAKALEAFQLAQKMDAACRSPTTARARCCGARASVTRRCPRSRRRPISTSTTLKPSSPTATAS
jgi:hypothetical protein